ncbi:peroxidase 66 [Senna tora]|uniref:Peroxidase n=1 Tax=Senna tora TaxID=362788 RepID=A0A834T2S3_9FABA|nr:peroxidase 66 [Senna tora]
MDVRAAILLLFLTMLSVSKAKLDVHYYEETCPELEKIVSDTLLNASKHDPKVPPRILRMFFHDCFIRGCDASVLLDSSPGNKAEKDGPPNKSVASFYVVDDAKAKIEKACPGTVSCADILAIAARDVVTMSGGPYWNVLKGRKDGRISKASDTLKLPPPSSNVTQLTKMFAKKGFGIKDLVTLSGAHTLGFSHCSSFQPRLHNFSSLHDTDPSIDSEFAHDLRTKCPSNKPHNHKKGKNDGHFLDSTASVFDNDYYKRMIARKSVLLSDQSLVWDSRTRRIVEDFARDQGLFFREFVDSMLKLGSLVNDVGEVRLNCRVVN